MSQFQSSTKKIHEKEFTLRNSLLIDLFENHHIRTVYHMFLALFVGFFVNTAAHNYIINGQVSASFRLIVIAFDKLHIALLGWLGFFLMTCLCFYLFKIWANFRNNLFKKQQFWDLLWLIATIFYYYVSFTISTRFIAFFELPPASAAIVCVEQTRLLMKLHAFLRVNVEKIMKYKPHTEQPQPSVEFSKFLYFLFAPTLIYRDEYPRTKEIRVDFVFFRLLEILGVILSWNFIFDRLFNHNIIEFCTRKFTVNEIILMILENSLNGILVLLLCFFILLHSWQNLFAELTRFGDRMFYNDWWTCVSFSEWFRKWNIIVHEWLHTYIYKDMYELVTNHNRILSIVTVFLISNIVHEWTAYCMFGIFFPLIFVEFFFGMLLNFVKLPNKPFLNVLFFYSLAIGMSSIVTMYTTEYFARHNLPVVNPTFKDYLIPRFLSCTVIKV